MPARLDEILDDLRRHQPELNRRGVAHAAVFGSMARGQATAASDIDALVELDPRHPIGVFEYAEIGLYLRELLGTNVDLVNKKTIKPLLRSNILTDAVPAF